MMSDSVAAMITLVYPNVSTQCLVCANICVSASSCCKQDIFGRRSKHLEESRVADNRPPNITLQFSGSMLLCSFDHLSLGYCRRCSLLTGLLTKSFHCGIGRQSWSSYDFVLVPDFPLRCLSSYVRLARTSYLSYQ